MNRILFVLLLLCFAWPTFAQPNPCANIAEVTKGKTPEQVSVILESCRKAPTLAEAVASDPDKAGSWAEAAKGFASAVGIVAKELGIAVNDFLQSPAGIILVVILALKYAGSFLVGVPFTVITLLIYKHIFDKLTTSSTTYESVPILWGAVSIRRKQRVERNHVDDQAAMTLLFTGFGVFVINLLVWIAL